jgi:hypothetical protein
MDYFQYLERTVLSSIDLNLTLPFPTALHCAMRVRGSTSRAVGDDKAN